MRGEKPTGEMMAHHLMPAYLHDSEDLKVVAVEKIKENRGLLKEEGFEKFNEGERLLCGT